MDAAGFINHLKLMPGYDGQITHVREIKSRPARFANTQKPLMPRLERLLKEKFMLPLYSHQARAVDMARHGSNVMVATSSASGKTLCYNIPVMEALLENELNCAIYFFPTTALAQDQLKNFRALFCPQILEEGEVDTYDGDTPLARRAKVRSKAKVIFSNPDMLNIGILPNHKAWSRLLRRLRYVVVDEAHIYRGVFGSHVAAVLRRLRRQCNLYGSNPQFILSSATIANGEEHARKLVNLPFEIINEDGSPHGGKDFVFWNPPVIDDAKSIRKSANIETSVIFTELVSRGVRTLAFARSRKLTELLFKYSVERLKEISPRHALRIKPYRAGYLAKDRRGIEKEMFGGQLDGIVATNALELGIDIGDLDATVLGGYPGSIASVWQQAGRSGRRGHRSLSFLIGMDDPINQYLMRHPEFLFDNSFESALINPSNSYIIKAHLLAAAWEHPLSGADAAIFGDWFAKEVGEMEEQGLLRKKKGRWHISPQLANPTDSINIRSASRQNYTLVDAASGTTLETVDESVAFLQIHQDAIYLHQGDSYLVTVLDIPSRTAYVKKTDVNYYTQPKDHTDLKLIRKLKSRRAGGTDVHLGEVEVTLRVLCYKKKRQFSEEIIGEVPLSLPPWRFNTIALWFDLPLELARELENKGLDLAGGLHALEHASIGILPLLALCDRNDIGGVSTLLNADTGRGAVFIYDAYPGGVGISEQGYQKLEELWRLVFKTISECPCDSGCPSCIQSYKCGNNNQPLDKKAALQLCQELLC